jgi:hypothetical protein
MAEDHGLGGHRAEESWGWGCRAGEVMVLVLAVAASPVERSLGGALQAFCRSSSGLATSLLKALV